MCTTGNGITLTLTQEPITAANLVGLGDIGETGSVIDDNDLVAGTLDRKCAGDLITYEPVEFTMRYEDTNKGEFDSLNVYDATSFHLTFPDGDTYTYTDGFILSRTVTGMDNNTRVLCTYTYQPTVAGTYATG